MPFYYLAPYVWVEEDEFRSLRPKGGEQHGWAAIDFRRPADQMQPGGRAFVEVPVADPSIGVALGDDLDAAKPQFRGLFAAELGVQVAGTTLRDILPALLILHATEDGTRWRPLQPTHEGKYEIWLGGKKIWDTPVLKGGSTITESCNTGDSDTPGPDLSWTELSGDMDVVSNQFSAITKGSAVLDRADTDLAGADHYAQCVMPTLTRGTSTSCGIGPICRKDSATTVTFYHYRANLTDIGLVNGHQLYKFVAGTATQLGSDDTTDWVAGEIIGVEANGSAIRGYRNRVVSIGPITDTAITGNTRTGLRAFTTAGTGVAKVNAFRAGDLSDIRTLAVAPAAKTPNGTHADTVAITIPSTTAGSTLVIMTQAGDEPDAVAEVSTVTASGATFVKQAAVTNSSGAQSTRAECWVATNVSAGITTVTVTWGAVTVGVVNCAEYPNVKSIGRVATATGSTANPTISVTTQDTNNFAVAGFANQDTAQPAFSVASRGTFWQNGYAIGDGSPDVSGALVDNAFPTAGALSNTVLYAGTSIWAAVAVELRSVYDLMPQAIM